MKRYLVLTVPFESSLPQTDYRAKRELEEAFRSMMVSAIEDAQGEDSPRLINTSGITCVYKEKLG